MTKPLTLVEDLKKKTKQYNEAAAAKAKVEAAIKKERERLAVARKFEEVFLPSTLLGNQTMTLTEELRSLANNADAVRETRRIERQAKQDQEARAKAQADFEIDFKSNIVDSLTRWAETGGRSQTVVYTTTGVYGITYSALVRQWCAENGLEVKEVASEKREGVPPDSVLMIVW